MLLENMRKAERITERIRNAERAIEKVRGGLFDLECYNPNTKPGQTTDKPVVDITPFIRIEDQALFETIQDELIATLQSNIYKLKFAFSSLDKSPEPEPRPES